jgi:glycine cleavage system H lipoate-binding protein
MVIVLVVLTFVALILVDVIIFNRQPKKSYNLAGAEAQQVFNLNDTLLPDDFYYSKGHTWVKVENSEKVNIGLDGFVLNALGKLNLKHFAEPGKKINKGDVIFEGAVNNVNLKFRSPVEGIVTAINSNNSVKDSNSWCLSLKPLKIKEDLTNLIPSSGAHKWIKSEFKRLKDLLIYSMEPSGLAGATMYDGGNIVEGAVSYIDEKSIKDFEELFLRV